jgi:hypothetical protein
MWSVILTCALACCGPPANANTPVPSEQTIAELASNLQTGSLIFSRGDCLAVRIFSQSSYTHVGGVVVKDGEATVYDSMNGAGVRKTPFVEYLRQQTPSEIHIVHPNTPFTDEKAIAYTDYLESQLGRNYAVRHHLTGHRCAGLHCSEYQTDALMAAEMIAAKNPPRVSPGSLLEGVMTARIYTEGNRVELKTVDPPHPVDRLWYQRVWHNTSTCCAKNAIQMRRWILCR